MTRVTVHEYAAALRPRYRAAKKGEKAKILDEFCSATGMHRKAVLRLLNQEVGRLKPVQRGRPRKYGPVLLGPLRQIWEAGDHMCGKLLHAALPDLVGSLERHGELDLTDDMRVLLLEMSAATIDRLLKKQAVRLSNLRPVARKAAQPSLKSEVPVKTWSEWKEARPGAMQADLVLLCGESLEGFYLTSLTVVDIASGWIEMQPVWGKGMERVGGALHQVRQRLPFGLKALHTDNGGEFINELLVPWCRKEGISLSRGRPYKKNDQAYVEQRNWHSVRRHVGYQRYSSHAAYDLLLKLYPLLCLQMNFFRPVRKLVSKERQGAKVIKRYDDPATPYQRMMTAGSLSDEAKAKAAIQLEKLNPAELKRQIEDLLRKLWAQADGQKGSIASVG